MRDGKKTEQFENCGLITQSFKSRTKQSHNAPFRVQLPIISLSVLIKKFAFLFSRASLLDE